MKSDRSYDVHTIESLEHLVIVGGRWELACELAKAYVNKAQKHIDLDEFRGAVVMFYRAINIYERLVKEDHPELAYELAGVYLDKALALSHLGYKHRAIKLSEWAIEIYERLLKEDRTDVAGDLATVYMDKADWLRDIGENRRAVDLHDRAIDIYERLVKEGQHNVADYLPLAYLNKGLAVMDLGDNAGAQQWYNRAMKIWEPLMSTRGQPYLANNVARVCMNKAIAIRGMGDYRTAVAWSDRAIEIQERLVNVEGHRELSNELADTYMNKALTLMALRHNGRAVELFDRAIEIWDWLVNSEGRYEYVGNLALVLAYRGVTIIRLGKPGKGRREAFEAMSVLRVEITRTDRADLKSALKWIAEQIGETTDARDSFDSFSSEGQEPHACGKPRVGNDERSVHDRLLKPRHDEVLKPGDILGDKYEISHRLAEGAFGLVYLAYDLFLREPVAIKAFRDEFLADAAKRETFKRECLLWVNLERHPFVLAAKLVHELSGRLFVAMDYVPPDLRGRVNLRDHLQQAHGGIDTETALRWAIQFCYGMEHVNAHGIRCHQDIKPANILISQDGTLKIADFGLAAATETAWDCGESMVGISGDGNFGYSLMQVKGRWWCGTPGYIAPEVYRGEDADTRSDIFSFGVVLWQVATGSLLPAFYVDVPYCGSRERFVEEYQRAIYERQMSGNKPHVDGPLSGVIDRCLMQDTSKRYKDFCQLRNELDGLYHKLTGRRVYPPEPDERTARFWNEKGASLTDLDRHTEARECFAKALAIDPRYASAWHNWGRSLHLTGSHEEAIQYYERAIGISEWPFMAYGWASKGGCLISLGRYEEAITCCDKALGIEQRLGYAWHNKGTSLEHLGRYEEARECYKEAVEINPRDADNWYAKAQVEEKLGKMEDAARSYRHFIGCAPTQYVQRIAFARQRLQELE